MKLSRKAAAAVLAAALTLSLIHIWFGFPSLYLSVVSAMDQPEKERHMLPQLFQALALPLRLAVADADQGQHRGHIQHGQRVRVLRLSLIHICV